MYLARVSKRKKNFWPECVKLCIVVPCVPANYSPILYKRSLSEECQVCQHYGTLLLLCHCATMWEKRVLSFTPSFMCWGSIILHWSSFRCVCQINWLLLFVTEKNLSLALSNPSHPHHSIVVFPRHVVSVVSPFPCVRNLLYFCFPFLCECYGRGDDVSPLQVYRGGGRGGPRSLLRPLNCVRNVCWSLATLKGPALPPPQPAPAPPRPF